MTETILKVVYISVDLLKTHPNNPRKVDERQMEILCQSLKDNKDYFETRPILCNKDMVIFAGNMRFLAAKKIGMKEVPVAVMDISEDRQKEIMIRDNRSNGQWDWDLLGNEFDIEDLTKWGFDEQELGLMSSSFDSGNETDPDDVPEVLPETTTVLGDVFEIGGHRVMCGDSTNKEHFNTLMRDTKASMVFTDPPYNVDYSGGGSYAENGKPKRKKIANDKMSSDNFYKFLFGALSLMVTYTQGAFYVCMSSSELHNLWKAFTDAGGHWQTYVIWAKDHFTLSRSDYQHQFEPIMYGLSANLADKMDMSYEESDGEAIMYGYTKHKWFGGRKQGDVWHFDRPKKSDLHPTMKPVMLCAKAIQNSSLVDQIVLDPFLGSGSTLIACEKTGRKCFGMELDGHYVDVIVKRWCDFTGQKSVIKNGVKVDNFLV